MIYPSQNSCYTRFMTVHRSIRVLCQMTFPHTCQIIKEWGTISKQKHVHVVHVCRINSVSVSKDQDLQACIQVEKVWQKALQCSHICVILFKRFHKREQSFANRLKKSLSRKQAATSLTHRYSLSFHYLPLLEHRCLHLSRLFRQITYPVFFIDFCKTSVHMKYIIMIGEVR